MNEELMEERAEKTLLAMNLVAECLRLNNISDSIAVSAMASLIANILVHHRVPMDNVNDILDSLNDAVLSIGAKFSRFDS
jgi:hypothetical protein